ncbi:MAG: hypothetical protein ABI389_12175 [Rhodanobacter sp.]
MRSFLRSAIAVCLFTVALCAVAASSTGTIRGHVQPNEQIVIVSASGSIVGVMSDQHGDFKAENLAPGQYSVALASAPSSPEGAPVFAGRVTTVTLHPKGVK